MVLWQIDTSWSVHFYDVQKKGFRFDIWSLLLFFVIMIPNFIWFALPAPNDVLRAASRTQALDAAASFCQILMVLALGILQNRECRKLRRSPFVIAVIACCLLTSCAAKFGQALIMVTHNPEIADRADRIIRIADGVICS